MLQLPVVASVPRFTVAFAFIGATLFGLGLHHHLADRQAARTVLLLLDAPSDPNCFYSSAWNDGPVYARLHDEHEEVAFSRHLLWVDRCEWESVETLTPVGGGRYRYQYSEVPVYCPPDAEPVRACPRSGWARAVPTAGAPALTPQSGDAASPLPPGDCLVEASLGDCEQ